MICDEDPLRRRPRESTARRKRQERCVWMARKMTEWPSKRGPITKIMPSDGCIGDTVPLAVGKWYEFHEFGWYMGNVGLDLVRGDLGHVAATSDLTDWARQGVLLLNTALTVPQGTPNGHRGLGWTPLITQVLGCLAPRSDIAWFMCGYRAKQRLPRIRSPHALVIRTGHPSRGHLFTATRPFSSINRHLGSRSINW